MKGIATLLLLMFSAVIYSQTKLEILTDSLENVAEGTHEHNALLIEIAEEYTGIHPDTALFLCRKLLPDLKKSKSPLLCKSYLNIGIAHSFKGEYDTSTVYSFMAINEARIHEDKKTVIDGFNNIGINFLYLEDYEQSKKYFLKVKDLSIQISDSSRLGHVLNNLGMIEGYQNNLQNELNYYDQAAIIFEAINEMEGLGNIILNSGTVYTLMEDFTKAHLFYDSAKSIFRKLGYYSGIQNTLLSQSENWLNQGDVEKATRTADEALQIAQKYKFLHDEVYTYDLLAQIAVYDQNYQSAYEYQKSYFQLKNEIFNIERSQQIDELNLKYETAEREKELIRASSRIQQKERNQLFFAILSAVILGASILIIYTQKQKNKLKEQAMLAELSELRIEIKTLIGKYEGTLDVGLEELNKNLVNPLSEREYDVFKQIFSQKTNSEIADELFVSINTVKTHLKNLYSKLGVSNRKEALSVLLNN